MSHMTKAACVNRMFHIRRELGGAKMETINHLRFIYLIAVLRPSAYA